MSGFKYCKQFETACEEIIACDRSSKKDIDFVEGIQSRSEKRGRVTNDEASWVGTLHTRIVNEGEYVEDGWWL